MHIQWKFTSIRQDNLTPEKLFPSLPCLLINTNQLVKVSFKKEDTPTDLWLKRLEYTELPPCSLLP